MAIAPRSNTLIALTLALLLEHAACVQRLDVDPKGSDERCAGSVSYVFLAREGLPLEKIWRMYLDKCAAGSYNVFVHSQKMVSPTMLPAAKLLQNPVQGELRTSYNMQAAMLKLYHEAAFSKTPNGCVPQWVQVLSDTCAPMSSCHDFQALLTKSPGRSFMNYYEFPESKDKAWSDYGTSRRPEDWQGKFFYQSQWNTLWMKHVHTLLLGESTNVGMWRHAFTPDEHYTINMLKLNGANVINHGLTKVQFTQANGIANTLKRWRSKGHPQHVMCPGGGSGEASQAMLREDQSRSNATESESLEVPWKVLVKAALTEGSMFARKFEPGCIDMLESFHLHMDR